jgi:1-aminocyclopropane-1-carboxylate deaminase/D-cysteine desulfhydrase-like pyridoxal-dependent ACC family enzyme
VIVGVGSTCTSAGLLVGLSLAAHLGLGFTAKTRPWLSSVRVSPWPVTSRFRILRLAARTAHLVHLLTQGKWPLLAQAELAARYEVDGRFLGPGYGKPSAAGEEAEALWAQAELPALDGTYSAKAAARLIADLRGNQPGPLLFWSTKSSVPLPTPITAETPPSALRIRDWLTRAERTLSPPQR